MRLKALLAAGLAAALGPSPVAAARYNGITISEIQAVLAQAGMQSTVSQTPDGIPFLRAQIPDTEVYILVAGISCPQRASCFGFGVAAWNDTAASPELLNRFNQSCCFVRASVEDSGKPRLTGDYVAAGGIEADNVVAGVGTFIEGMQRYVELRSGKSASLALPARPSGGKAFAGAAAVLGSAAKSYGDIKLTKETAELVAGWAARPAAK